MGSEMCIRDRHKKHNKNQQFVFFHCFEHLFCTNKKLTSLYYYRIVSAGIVPDICGCCEECAKGLNEKCGGLWDIEGTCTEGLTCVASRNEEKPWLISPGLCMSNGKICYLRIT